ncbi:MAG: bacteriocin transporter ATPase [Chthonomonadaceae bacterium]|nr:bacteriocin transporter ATPase [Chthonomonadaceae bacterium]
MLAVPPRLLATLSPAPKPQDRRLILCYLPLLVCLSLTLSGCHTRPVGSATSLASARSVSSPSSAVVQLQSSPLYQQARLDCTRHDYRRAADHLQTLARTPGLAPDALAFVEKQRQICLRHVGLSSSTSVVVTASLPARSPADADCGPRALLIVCQKLGVKTDLETLRKMAGTTAEGTTMAGLEQAAQKLGLKAEGVQVSREALPDISGMAIAWANRNHYIALLKPSSRGEDGEVVIADPNQTSEQKISMEHFLQVSGGYLLLIHR